jgi:CRP/FNR family transcriptional regulator
MKQSLLMTEYELSKYFPVMAEKALREELLENAEIHQFPANSTLLDVGKYVKVLPLVLNGSIKVVKEADDKEILMYYIRPGESCIMSISACISNEKFKIKAITEEKTELLLVPYTFVNIWLQKYSTWNTFVINAYKNRFEHILDAFNAVAFQKMDERLLHYLKQKAQITKSKTIKVTHQQIANDLATARVVISRLLKELEHQGKIEQARGEVRLL